MKSTISYNNINQLMGDAKYLVEASLKLKLIVDIDGSTFLSLCMSIF